jgi:hypothetical protein
VLAALAALASGAKSTFNAARKVVLARLTLLLAVSRAQTTFARLRKLL